MQIIEKDISWLIEKVPDFNANFYETNREIFDNGGYLAGGFLRKMITHGSANTAFFTLGKGSTSGDVDWFFTSQPECETAWKEFCVRYCLVSLNVKNPNSLTHFAFESAKEMKVAGTKLFIKYQFIHKSYGNPSTVLNRFDISNCKIATNGKKVWMVEDWEKLEEDKFIRVDNFAGLYFISRLKKYVAGDFSILPSQKDEVLVKMLESVEKYQSPIKKLINDTDIVSLDSILLFHNKLGDYNEIVSLEDYNQGTLGKTEDFALHMYNKKKEQQCLK